MAGRPSSYQPIYAEQAAKLCLLGATDEEIAQFFGTSTRTIYRWKLDHEDFCQALKAGKDSADDRVERSLYQKASGFAYTEQQAFKIKTVTYAENGKRLKETEAIKVVDVERYCLPDTTAQIFWLKNRRSADWRDKQDHDVRLSRLNDLTDDELAAIASGSGNGTAPAKASP
jgi:hypothetical protein